MGLHAAGRPAVGGSRHVGAGRTLLSDRLACPGSHLAEGAGVSPGLSAVHTSITESSWQAPGWADLTSVTSPTVSLDGGRATSCVLSPSSPASTSLFRFYGWAGPSYFSR